MSLLVSMKLNKYCEYRDEPKPGIPRIRSNTLLDDMLKPLLFLVYLAPSWPSDWLGEHQEGHFTVLVTLNENCDLYLSNLKAAPDNLNIDLAKSLVTKRILKDSKKLDTDNILSKHPGVDFSSVLSWEEGQSVSRTIDEYGPWALTRTVQIGNKQIKCTFSKESVLLKVSGSQLPFSQAMMFEFRSE